MRSRLDRIQKFLADARVVRKEMLADDHTHIDTFDREVALRVVRELEFERDAKDLDVKAEAPRDALGTNDLDAEFAPKSVVTPETDANGDRGSGKGWMGTSTGRKFWPLSPRPEDVDVRDIARGLAMTCRYGGQIKRYYSVAEHCVLVSRHVAPELALKALFHDSAEAYIGDMIRPLKHQGAMAAFRTAEREIEACINLALGLNVSYAEHAAIKVIDDRILIDEICALSARPDYYLSTPLLKDKQALGVPIYGWTPSRAEAEFKQRYFEICGIDLDNLKGNHP